MKITYVLAIMASLGTSVLAKPAKPSTSIADNVDDDQAPTAATAMASDTASVEAAPNMDLVSGDEHWDEEVEERTPLTVNATDITIMEHLAYLVMTNTTKKIEGDNLRCYCCGTKMQRPMDEEYQHAIEHCHMLTGIYEQGWKKRDCRFIKFVFIMGWRVHFYEVYRAGPRAYLPHDICVAYMLKIMTKCTMKRGGYDRGPHNDWHFRFDPDWGNCDDRPDWRD